MRSMRLIYKERWKWVWVDPSIPSQVTDGAILSGRVFQRSLLVCKHLLLPIKGVLKDRHPEHHSLHRQLAPSGRRWLSIPKSSQLHMVTKPRTYKQEEGKKHGRFPLKLFTSPLMLPSARSQPSSPCLSSSTDSRLFWTRPDPLSLESLCPAVHDKEINFLWLERATTSHPSIHQLHSSTSHHIPRAPPPSPHHLQSFLHNKTSPDLAIITLSPHLIGK